MVRVLSIIEDTMVDGPGFRTSIYCAGCRHKCPGCHNPQSWDFKGGRWMSTEELMKIIVADPFANVTFTGGDPMYQCDGFAELARAILKQTNKDIWCYTGFTFESLITRAQRELLSCSTWWSTDPSSRSCATRTCSSEAAATSASSMCRNRSMQGRSASGNLMSISNKNPHLAGGDSFIP